MALVWGAYTKLGEPIAEFPALEVKSSLSTIIGRADSVSVQLPGRDRMPANWEFATRPLRTVMAAVEWGQGVPYVVWAGWVEKRQYGSGPYVELTLQPADGIGLTLLSPGALAWIVLLRTLVGRYMRLLVSAAIAPTNLTRT